MRMCIIIPLTPEGESEFEIIRNIIEKRRK